MYGDKILIKNINGEIQVDNEFKDYYDDSNYCVLDKQTLGESIGRDILDEYDEGYGIDIIDNCHIAYQRIEKEITDNIKNDIFDFIEEYIDNNTE